ncbi:dihydroneopterin aldolase [Bacillus coahuilensis m2-6]|uniref:7,8-dihydroneopterin aldolase n=1 Tax=Bacillus coahuilensis p1.1.43 TaxID=1150625 RepID=A0A147K4U0_9BACI|nr:dihydroneopterin aldolase [Bacillus coahuilensis]KUP04200.1 dihydroneopterin aldolase [Bacillus coahuilensis m2-6]KUP04541.1 dihydroneopterin aldolase [Bacillus coahuilensis p1.1.43]
MDKIIVQGMKFYGYHGVFPEETKLGQRFEVDLTVHVSLQKAGESDDLHDSINYGELYNECRDIVEGQPFKLVEAVAEKIASTLLQKYLGIQQVTVKLIKPDPPIPGHYKYVAIEITRGRSL